MCRAAGKGWALRQCHSARQSICQRRGVPKEHAGRTEVLLPVKGPCGKKRRDSSKLSPRFYLVRGASPATCKTPACPGDALLEHILDTDDCSQSLVYSPGARAQAVSLLEALSCGAVLALARESFASPLLRDGGNVLLLEEQSTGDFALALNERLNNTDLLQKIRQGARETVVRNFAQDRVLPMQTRFLETCTGHERRRGHRVLAQSCKWRGTFM